MTEKNYMWLAIALLTAFQFGVIPSPHKSFGKRDHRDRSAILDKRSESGARRHMKSYWGDERKKKDRKKEAPQKIYNK